VDANVKILTGDTTYTAEDRKLLKDYVSVALKRKPMKDMKVDKI